MWQLSVTGKIWWSIKLAIYHIFNNLRNIEKAESE